MLRNPKRIVVLLPAKIHIFDLLALPNAESTRLRRCCSQKPWSLVAPRCVAPANQTKERAKTKSSYEFHPFFCEFWCFSLGNKHDSHIELLFRNAPAKGSWSGLVCRGHSWLVAPCCVILQYHSPRKRYLPERIFFFVRLPFHVFVFVELISAKITWSHFSWK